MLVFSQKEESEEEEESAEESAESSAEESDEDTKPAKKRAKTSKTKAKKVSGHNCDPCQLDPSKPPHTLLMPRPLLCDCGLPGQEGGVRR